MGVTKDFTSKNFNSSRPCFISFLNDKTAMAPVTAWAVQTEEDKVTQEALENA